MKNVTVSLDDDTYLRARRRAAGMATSLSAMVRSYLRSVGEEETDGERLLREQNALFAEIDAKVAGRFNAPLEPGWRDALYDRTVSRSK